MTDLATIIGNAEWLAHRYDERADMVQFRFVPRALHERVTFITDDHLPADAPMQAFPRQAAVSAQQSAAPVHYIFHSAYCCSTLLARAFDCAGLAMGLKEPVILNDVVGWRRRGGPDAGVARALDSALRLLARPFAPGEATVIKPSTVVNGFAEAMLALRPNASALFLHAPLPDFLGSIARKGMWGRLWIRELLTGMLRDGLIDLGFTGEDYLKLTDLQVAAVCWLGQHALFARLIARFPERTAALDSASLLAEPTTALTALADMFKIELDRATIARQVSGPAFSSHSKTGARFSAADRASEQADATQLHGDEIDKVASWAASVAANAGVPLVLPRQLLDRAATV